MTISNTQYNQSLSIARKIQILKENDFNVDQEQFGPEGNILYCLETIMVSQLGGGEKGATGTWQVKAKEAAKRSTMHMTFPQKKRIIWPQVSIIQWLSNSYVHAKNTYISDY